MTASYRVEPGSPWPLGATLIGDGVNFSLCSGSAEQVELCLYADGGETELGRVFLTERAADIWHGFVPGLGPGQRYGYRVHGPYDLGRGLRFNAAKLLLDPYARAWDRPLLWADPALGHQLGEPEQESVFDPRDSGSAMAKSVVTAPSRFDWEDDRSPNVPLADSVIYELHVKGFTWLHDGVPEALRGKFLGLAADAPIEYLQRLGITAVELMPIMAFLDEPLVRRRGLVNYWGYNTLGFFMPDARYVVEEGSRELKTLVKRLHRAGIEVILDVVYNHTAEGDQAGPILSFRGIDNPGYYRLEPQNPARYENPTGTGNALDMRQPHVLQLVMDSLRWWAEEYRVDGFRFDLATVLARGDGGFDQRAAFFVAVEQDPVLQRLKLIAEPWDAGPGGYALGRFPAGWSEWNGVSRDDLRRFFLTRDRSPGVLADRLSGSSDLFRSPGRGPQASVNFVACHDGFTLEDLVSYAQKHNEANGEANRDGAGQNFSVNHGAEGPTADPAIRRARDASKRALLAALLCAHGVPMLTMGDELGRSQGGNNNAWCQDNATSWLDWTNADHELAEFVQRLIELRRCQPPLRCSRWLEPADVEWTGPDGRPMTPEGWQDLSKPMVGMRLLAHGGGSELLLLANGGPVPVPFTVPGAGWSVVLDSARPDATGAAAGRGELGPTSIQLLSRSA